MPKVVLFFSDVIIRLDRMIHRIIQGEIDDPTGLPGQAGHDRHSRVALFWSDDSDGVFTGNFLHSYKNFDIQDNTFFT
jgi:hypothetical protein